MDQKLAPLLQRTRKLRFPAAEQPSGEGLSSNRLKKSSPRSNSADRSKQSFGRGGPELSPDLLGADKVAEKMTPILLGRKLLSFSAAC